MQGVSERTIDTMLCYKYNSVTGVTVLEFETEKYETILFQKCLPGWWRRCAHSHISRDMSTLNAKEVKIFG